MDELLLAVDCGTQSTRSMVFDAEGHVVAGEKVEYEPYRSPRPGWAEQDPEVFWEGVRSACRRLFDNNPGLTSRLAAMAVTTQRDTMICMDRNGAALRPAITWLDTRKDPGTYRPGLLGRTVYRLFGILDTIGTSMADGKVNWIRRHEPRVWAETWKYTQVSGFFHYRLTGNAVDSVSSNVGHIPMDYRRRRWARTRNIRSKLFPVEPEKRCRLVEPGEPVGTVTAEAARLLGIPAGLPVFAAGSDKACESLGMGVMGPGTASLSFGTTATVSMTTRRYVEPMAFMPAYCAAVPGFFNPEIEIFRGFWMVSWFKNEMGTAELEEAERTGTLPEDLFDRLLDGTPPGNLGLMLQPYWGPGLKNPHARGSIVGFGDTHDRGAIYRAIMEGLAYALREGLERLERRTGGQVAEVAASGGASKNRRICRLTADVLGRPVYRAETYEASSLGAAMVAAVGAGIHDGFETAVRRMVRVYDRFEPRPEYRELYDRLFELYREIYPRLERFYKKLQRITGYPELPQAAQPAQALQAAHPPEVAKAPQPAEAPEARPVCDAVEAPSVSEQDPANNTRKGGDNCQSTVGSSPTGSTSHRGKGASAPSSGGETRTSSRSRTSVSTN